jgi:hypothetical protein
MSRKVYEERSEEQYPRRNDYEHQRYYQAPHHYHNFHTYETDRIERNKRDQIYQSDQIERNRIERKWIERNRIERDLIERDGIERNRIEREIERGIERDRIQRDDNQMNRIDRNHTGFDRDGSISDFELLLRREGGNKSYLTRTRYDSNDNHSSRCFCSRMSCNDTRYDETQREIHLENHKLSGNMDYSVEIGRKHGSEEPHFKHGNRRLDVYDYHDPKRIEVTHPQSNISLPSVKNVRPIHASRLMDTNTSMDKNDNDSVRRHLGGSSYSSPTFRLQKLISEPHTYASPQSHSGSTTISSRSSSHLSRNNISTGSNSCDLNKDAETDDHFLTRHCDSEIQLDIIQKQSVISNPQINFARDPNDIVSNKSDHFSGLNTPEIDCADVANVVEENGVVPNTIVDDDSVFLRDPNDGVRNKSDHSRNLNAHVTDHADVSRILETNRTQTISHYDSNDLVFIFEEPTDEYSHFTQKFRTESLALGCLNKMRMSKMKCIHVVTQPKEGIQITFARNLDIPHYQLQSKVFKEGINNIPCPVKHYTKDETSSFLTVISQESLNKKANDYLDQVDWLLLGVSLLERNNVSSATRSKRQAIHQDFGYCCGQNTGHIADDDITNVKSSFKKSITRPRAKKFPGNIILKSCAFNAIEILSKAMDHIDFPKKPFNFDKERLCDFAQRLAPENRVEAFRIAMTTEGYPCGIHTDDHNAPDFPEVVSFSKYIEYNEQKWRISIICYSRKSISDYYNRLKKDYGPSLKAVSNFVDHCDMSRMKVLPDTRKKLLLSDHVEFGVHFANMDCHFNPVVGTSPVIHFTLLLTLKFNLCYIELMSLMLAWVKMPFSHFFYCMSIGVFMRQGRLPCRGPLLGYHLLQYMCAIKECLASDKVPGLQFPIPSVTCYPPETEWNDTLSAVTTVFIDSLQTKRDRPSSKQERRKTYRKFFKETTNHIFNADAFIGNQLISVCAIIGTCPTWFMDESFIGRGNKNIKYLQSQYKLPLGVPATDTFLNSLSFLFKDKNTHINADADNNNEDADSNVKASTNDDNDTESFSENILSRFVRSKTVDSILRFSDLSFLHQCTFESFGNGMCKIHFSDNFGNHLKTKVWQGPLLYQWSIGNDVFPMHIFAQKVTSTGDHSVFSNYNENPPNIRPSWLESDLSNPCNNIDSEWCETIRKMAYNPFSQSTRHAVYSTASDPKPKELSSNTTNKSRKRKGTKSTNR